MKEEDVTYLLFTWCILLWLQMTEIQRRDTLAHVPILREESGRSCTQEQLELGI